MNKLLKIAFCGSVFFSSISLADVAIIVNVDNDVTLSDTDISRLFLGKLKKFPSGQKAVAVNLKLGSTIRDEFESKVLGKSASQIKAYWSKRVFSGKGKPPQELVSDNDVLTMVASNSNAIAYVDAATVNDTVKVIKTF